MYARLWNINGNPASSLYKVAAEIRLSDPVWHEVTQRVGHLNKNRVVVVVVVNLS